MWVSAALNPRGCAQPTGLRATHGEPTGLRSTNRGLSEAEARIREIGNQDAEKQRSEYSPQY
jgi:hypothetical protein